MNLSHSFSRALRQLQVITSSCDWSNGIGFVTTMLHDWLKNSHHIFNQSWLTCTRFPALCVSYMQLLRVVIGSLELVLRQLWYTIVSKTRATLSTNRESLALVFPRFASATCNCLELWLVQWIADALWLAREITLVFGFMTLIWKLLYV